MNKLNKNSQDGFVSVCTSRLQRVIVWSQ